jgi:hypothetical protein
MTELQAYLVFLRGLTAPMSFNTDCNMITTWMEARKTGEIVVLFKDGQEDTIAAFLSEYIVGIVQGTTAPQARITP